jgi:hypothetical protein
MSYKLFKKLVHEKYLFLQELNRQVLGWKGLHIQVIILYCVMSACGINAEIPYWEANLVLGG